MENVNEINIEDKGFYDGVECTVVDIINDITIAVIGPFNFSCFFEAYYKSFFHKILGIKSYKER